MKPMRAKCAKCGDIVEVSHFKEYKSCKCGAISLDYGDGYYSRMGGNPEDFDKEFDKAQGIEDRFKPFKIDKPLGSNTDFFEVKPEEKFYDTQYYGYSVSKSGKVKGPSGKILKPQDNFHGYDMVNISCYGKVVHRTVHRIVAETFLPNEEGFEQINHKDGNKKNNNVENLEWCDRSDNMKHAARELKKAFGFASRPVRNLTTGRMFFSIGEAAESIGRNHSSLHEALNKGTKCAGDYWVYDDNTDDMNELVERVLRWFDDKGLSDSVMQMVKVQEEVGELAHQISRNKLHDPETEDALGDILVTIIGMCHHLHYHPAHALALAYNTIKNRKGKVVDGSFVKEENA